jgi:shikimate dehydrogenase
MRTYGLIGYPLKHSFSPEYFTKKFQQENIQAVYKLFPIAGISELPGIIENHPSLAGLNVTIPYKEQVIDFLDDIRGDAEKINAVNTIVIQHRNNSVKLIGYNTDTIGFQQSLQTHLSEQIKTALILGSGATSKTVAWVLKRLNIGYTFVTRQKKGKQNFITYEDLSPEIIRQNKLIINTTPVGMYPDVDDFPSLNYDAINEEHVAFDVIYNPPLTRFLSLCQQAGAKTINGHKMLEYQAEESWKLWNTNQ